MHIPPRVFGFLASSREVQTEVQLGVSEAALSADGGTLSVSLCYQIACMIVEFCNRWIINGWDSYYNTFANELFGMTSTQFAFGLKRNLT